MPSLASNLPSFGATFTILCALLLLSPRPAAAQEERVRISANAGRQVTTHELTQQETFQQFFEQGSFIFEHTTPADVFFDAGAAVRVWRGLQAGFAISFFENTGTGTVDARVPHPLQFNQPRTTSGEISGVKRREVGQHITIGWIIPTVDRLDFTVFGGPSIFTTEQTLVTGLTLSLASEVFPFDELAFPGAQTETVREHVVGYNAGVDMTWRFTDHVGVGALFRYAAGKKDFAPTDGTPVEVKIGGLQAGGGLRVVF